jgi:hypothetical protein
VRRAVVLWLSLAASFPARADPLDPKDVPAPLKPWVPWALHGAEERTCPRLTGEAEGRACAWPARLSLEVNARGGRFRLEVELFARDTVPLPGDAEHWPLDVRDARGGVPVVAESGRPAVLLGPGSHTLTGSFAWDSVPAALGIPEAAALVVLQLDGRRIAHPELDESGRLFLRRPERAAGEAERVDIQVQRRLADGVPFLLTTRVVLDVSGKAREVLLGRALPDGFTPLRLDAPLAARLEPDGRLRVQVRPGKWVLTLVARKETPVPSLTRPAPGGPWTSGDEIWVFDPAPAIRVVTLEGLASVDPSQTQLPPQWMSLATYAARPGDTLKLVEQRRGNADPEPDQLALDRQLWLDVDGRGWTVRDSIQGSISRSWRLEMPAPTTLGRASVNGREQPLTRLSATAAPGVEVRQGALSLVADSRLPDPGVFPAVSWAHDFTRAGAVLHLPPGWKLVGASGVDEVRGTWVQRWSLLDLFLVLVLALAAAKLHGWRVGALALLTLVLTFPEPDAPRWTWVAVLAAEALARVAPAGKLRTAMRAVRWVTFGLLAIALVAFAVDHLRQNLYPILGGPSVAPRQDTGALDTADRRVPAAPMATPEPTSASEMEAEPLAEPKAVPPPAPPAADELKRVMKPKKDSGKGREEVAAGVEGGVVGGVMGGVVGGVASTAPSRSATVAEVDRQAVVQTGPGIPAWRWQDVPLRWSGPVLQGQTLRLWLFSPFENRLLAFVRVLLLALLAARLLVGSGVWTPPRLGRLRGAAVAMLALLLAGPVRAQEDHPSDERLDKLRALLLEAPRCAPDCASAGRGLLEVEPGSIRLRVELQASAPRVAVPLAGGGEGWTPELVVVDGRPASALRRIGGVTWVVLSPGIHTVVLSGPLPATDTVQVPLGLAPRHLEVQARGWKVDGVRDDGRPESTLQLSRTERSGGVEALRPGALPPFARVERTLRLGLTWEVETQVVRLSPPESAMVLQVPLLPGESVLTADLPVTKGVVAVNLAPGAERLGWRSTLTQSPAVLLTALRDVPWVELWALDTGPMWNVGLSGIPPVHPASSGALPSWQPWPGESLRIQVTRPEGIGGATLTLDQAVVTVRPGLRSTETTLQATLRTTRGDQHAIHLPAGAEVMRVVVNGAPQPARLDAGRLLFSLAPPLTRVEVVWREPRGISLFFRPSEVDVGAPGVNAYLTVSLPTDRWILWLGGPAFGPVVLFWGALLVTLLVAGVLARVPHSPLRLGAWVLLAIGLTQVPVPTAALVVFWLLALAWRRAYGARVRHSGLFDLMQVALVALTLAALVVLFEAVKQGLLGQPDMQIAGNSSTPAVLHWAQDRVQGPLPTPLVISVPLLVYRLAMLAWALWLATALLGWLRRGWQAFSTGGFWRLPPPKPAPTVAAGPPAGPKAT